MTITLDLNPEIGRGLLALAQQRGVSPDVYLQDIVAQQVSAAAASRLAEGKIPALPIRRLGTVGSLHRRDIYDNVD